MIPPKWACVCGEKRYQRCDEGKGGRIGSGSFGAVYIGVDKLTNDVVAVKRQQLPSTEATREIALYQLLRAWPHKNVLAMRDTFTSTANGSSCLYFVFDLLSSTVWDTWRSPVGRRGMLDRSLSSRYMLDIVRGVGHLHDLSMVHADLSMKNLLVGIDHVVKVADLGAAFSASTFLVGSEARTTAYVRAPEVFLGTTTPTASIDSWAVGVVGLALFTGDCPFVHGENDVDVWRAQIKLLGFPTESSWPGHGALPEWKKMQIAADVAKSPANVADSQADVAHSQADAADSQAAIAEFCSRTPIERPLGAAHPAVPLLQSFLRWSPETRATMNEAENSALLLKHADIEGEHKQAEKRSSELGEHTQAEKRSSELMSDQPHSSPGDNVGTSARLTSRKTSPLSSGGSSSPRNMHAGVSVISSSKDIALSSKDIASSSKGIAPSSKDVIGNQVAAVCGCAGQCGRLTCKNNQHLRSKNADKLISICDRPTRKGRFCNYCACEFDNCTSGRKRTDTNFRWCARHHREFSIIKKGDYVTNINKNKK